MNRKQRRLAHKRQGNNLTSTESAAALVVQNLFADACRHHQAGRLPEAEGACRQLLAINPRHADGLHLLGMIAFDSGRPAAAVDLIGRAIRLRDNIPLYQYNLGVAFQKLGKFGEAAAHYQRAIALKSDYAEAHNNLGNVLKAQGKLGEAMAHYRRAVAFKPDYAEAHHNLGNALKEQGQLDEARCAYERALELAPRNGRYYRHLFDIKRVAAGDRGLAAAEKLAAGMASLPTADQTQLHFALGKAYADLERHERSFRHLLKGNAFKRQEFSYDEPKMLRFLDRIRTVFTPELMCSKRNMGNPSIVPIFIVGMPRSGTTLVEQILASHPKVFGAGELGEFNDAVTRLGANGALTFPEGVPTLAAKQLHQLGKSYLDAVAAAAPEAERITDKLPGNFSFVGLIHLSLPNARIIHTRRDPIDTCLSAFSQLFTGDVPYAYDLGELGRFYRGYEMLMEHWRQVLPPGAMLEVDYEEVVADIERLARQIVAYCGLEWDDACLAFYKTQRPVRTASATQVRQPIYRTSVGRWKAYRHLLRPLITELGVEFDEAR